MALLLQRSMMKLSRRNLAKMKDWGLENRRRGMSTDSAGRLEGKVALITGAASGIGRATAIEFLKNGAKVIIADIQHKLGEETAADLGPDATFVHCDVTQESSVSSAVDFAVSKHGRLDISYYNAGICGSIKHNLANIDLADFDRVMAINVRGVVTGIKHAARVMVPRQSGCILCTASTTGVLGGMAPLPYSVSKFAVAGIVKSAAPELGANGIRVNCISPFAIPTSLTLDGMSEFYPEVGVNQLADIVRATGVLKGAICEVEDIAKAALYLASEDAKYVSGHNLVVDGGFTSFKTFGFPTPSEVM